eukprot:CAMPEP_0201551692 /NCGR_PEP_ID=MMETSP0173_2-20130828/9131_1 /ASSEMBLY_ACC=CAM_ASM_000268 /TAXON_ID=218659 /ORGANISM="Vexillifera sp., Strain DIVA3 564/2" /LENGTH=205 /DNA_ID=CAMNT_0047962013 /DNA_START=30 /DNA_END=648 /DNA_ORIENTATION=+
MSYNRRGGRGRGRGGYGRYGSPAGPPDYVIELGEYTHPCEKVLVCRSTHEEKLPKFNSPVYYENKQQIGKVDEVFGAINEVYFTIAPVDGIVPSSFPAKTKIYIADFSLLPMKMFTDPTPPKRAAEVEEVDEAVEVEEVEEDEEAEEAVVAEEAEEDFVEAVVAEEEAEEDSVHHEEVVVEDGVVHHEEVEIEEVVVDGVVKHTI